MPEHDCAVRRNCTQAAGEPFSMPQVLGPTLTALPVVGKAPPCSPHRSDPHPGDNVVLWVEDAATGGKLCYARDMVACQRDHCP